jgi:hypothetical protein
MHVHVDVKYPGVAELLGLDWICRGLYRSDAEIYIEPMLNLPVKNDF